MATLTELRPTSQRRTLALIESDQPGPPAVRRVLDTGRRQRSSDPDDKAPDFVMALVIVGDGDARWIDVSRVCPRKPDEAARWALDAARMREPIAPRSPRARDAEVYA